MLSSDLLGFHTYDYARHFTKACTRILGLESAPNGVFVRGLEQPDDAVADGGKKGADGCQGSVSSFDRFVPTGVFPVGIDPGKFDELLKTSKVQQRTAVC